MPEKKGSLRKTLGVSKKTGKIPVKKLTTVAKGSGKTAKRARLAITVKKMHHK
jgi:hypothetical protein